MITDTPIRLATPADAAGIAAMSRDLIERGLGWKWTVTRVRNVLGDPETNVAVIPGDEGIQAFGIMSYRDDVAHLLLFAVRETYRRRGLGSRLLRWLEDVAHTAGIERIHVECRRDNAAARDFYGEHGYHELVISKGYYGGVEDAIRFEKLLGNQ
jgi:[ribosomal protein S18]-alanine N-acetyltransferase